jgi:uncharacterized protein YbjT (DUF2867 family)
LFGPKELTQFEIAEILSEVLGRKITYVPMEIEAFKGVLKNMGYTPHFSQHVSAVAQDCRDGVFFRNKRLGGKAHGSNATPNGGLHHQEQGSVQFS